MYLRDRHENFTIRNALLYAMRLIRAQAAVVLYRSRHSLAQRGNHDCRTARIDSRNICTSPTVQKMVRTLRSKSVCCIKHNTKICYNISTYHEGEWNPLWRMRTIIIGIFSMLLDSKTNGIGHIPNTSLEKHKEFSKDSIQFNKINVLAKYKCEF